MAEKHTSTLSSLYQQRKTHYVLPEEARQNIIQQASRKRRTTWRVAIPSVFASLLVVFIIWPDQPKPTIQSATMEASTQMSESFMMDTSPSITMQSEERIAPETQTAIPDEALIEAPAARRFSVTEYSDELMADNQAETETFDLNKPMWLFVKSVTPLILKNCSNQRVEIDLTNELTENQWIQIRADQTHWRIDQQQSDSPCDGQ